MNARFYVSDTDLSRRFPIYTRANVGEVAVIVSRELGIQCVVSATGATRRIPNGARVRVDGSTGTVTVL